MSGRAGTVAMVAGGASLIGATVVRAFHAAGARVAIVDVDEERGAALATELGDGALFVATDLRSDDQIRACVERTVEEFGGLDALVNMACSYLDHGARTTRQEWHDSLDVNLVGHAILALAARPHLSARSGAIVNVTSISSKVAQSGRWSYPAAKSALVQLTRSMAVDLAADGIRVNSVSLGWTWSAVMDAATGGNRAAVDEFAAPFHVVGRLVDPSEAAHAVLFLASPAASAVTGADWAVDGGYSALGPERADAVLEQLAG